MALSRRTLLTSTAAAAVASTALPGIASASTPAQTGQPDTAALTHAVEYTMAKLRAVEPTVTGFPEGTKFEKWTFTSGGDWVGGFWVGLFWLSWLYSGDATFQQWAEKWALKLAPRETDTSTHDVGFLFTPSWITAYRLTGDTSWRDGAITAAGSLIQRYNPAGKFIRAWGSLGTPDNVHALTLARAFHDAVRTRLPEVEPLPEPLPVEPLSLF